MRKCTVLEFLNTTEAVHGRRIRLRHKCIQDAVQEYRWRQDIELCELDAASPITATFQEYIHWYTADGTSSSSYVLAIETLNGRHIGNCGCFNIDDIRREVEIGIMIGEKSYWNHGYGEEVLRTLVQHLFENTHVDRIYLKTLDWNLRAHRCFEKCGFKSCGRLNHNDHKFLLMELRRPKAIPAKRDKIKDR